MGVEGGGGVEGAQAGLRLQFSHLIRMYFKANYVCDLPFDEYLLIAIGA